MEAQDDRATLCAFAGRWTLRREIRDLAAGRQGEFRGEALFRPVPGGLAYAETGWLRYGSGAPMRAERRYLWRPDGPRIAVDFEDGRPFHAFDPAEALTEAVHLCDPDRYEVAYDFAAWPRWRTSWRVTGPRKDYEMRSEFSRARSADDSHA